MYAFMRCRRSNVTFSDASQKRWGRTRFCEASLNEESHQLCDRRSAVEDGMRSAALVGEAHGRVDAQDAAVVNIFNPSKLFLYGRFLDIHETLFDRLL